MRHRRRLGVLIGCVGCALVAGAALAVAQQPNRRIPDEVKPAASVDLADIGLPGRVGAVRVTVNPGTRTDPHAHEGRTSLLIMVQGQLVEYRNDVAKVYKQGDVFTVANHATHSVENKWDVPAVYVEVNISANAPASAK